MNASTRTMGRRARLLACVVVLACAAGQALARDNALGCREYDLPEGQAMVVTPSTVVNGLPMAVVELNTRLGAEDVRKFYLTLWRGQASGVFEMENEGWQIVAMLDGNCYYTAQIKPAGTGARALLGVSRVPDRSKLKEAGAGFPRLPGSQVLTDMLHDDGMKKGRTLLLSNAHSARVNADFYKQALVTDGWELRAARIVPNPAGTGYVLYLKRGLEERNVTIAGSRDGTNIIANTVDRP